MYTGYIPPDAISQHPPSNLAYCISLSLSTLESGASAGGTHPAQKRVVTHTGPLRLQTPFAQNRVVIAFAGDPLLFMSIQVTEPRPRAQLKLLLIVLYIRKKTIFEGDVSRTTAKRIRTPAGGATRAALARLRSWQ